MDLEKQKYWLKKAYLKATYSPDPSTQHGAVVLNEEYNILSSACNRFPPGVKVTEDLLERQKKYLYIEHAERAAIYNYVKCVLEDVAKGEKPAYAMVVTWPSCTDCARAIVMSGIKVLIRSIHDDIPERWKDNFDMGTDILQSGGVEIIEYTEPLGDCAPVLRSGQLWHP